MTNRNSQLIAFTRIVDLLNPNHQVPSVYHLELQSACRGPALSGHNIHSTWRRAGFICRRVQIELFTLLITSYEPRLHDFVSIIPSCSGSLFAHGGVSASRWSAGLRLRGQAEPDTHTQGGRKRNICHPVGCQC